MSVSNPRIKLTLPRPETITDLGIVLNTHYAKATKVNLYYRRRPEAGHAGRPSRPATVRTSTLEPRKASALTIELADFDKPSQTTGIDNLWITRGPLARAGGRRSSRC